MISIIEYTHKYGTKTQSFTCSCGKQHSWAPRTQQSPYNCLNGCNYIMPDITKVVLEKKWRVAYHLGGRGVIKCGVSL